MSQPSCCSPITNSHFSMGGAAPISVPSPQRRQPSSLMLLWGTLHAPALLLPSLVRESRGQLQLQVPCRAVACAWLASSRAPVQPASPVAMGSLEQYPQPLRGRRRGRGSRPEILHPCNYPVAPLPWAVFRSWLHLCLCHGLHWVKMHDCVDPVESC